MKNVRLIVFDWDGTLMDSEARIVACMREAGKDVGLAALDDGTLRNVIGLGLKEAIETLYPLEGRTLHRAFADRYRHHFLSEEHEASLFFSGAMELVRDLRRRHMLLGVATGKSRRGLDRVLAERDCESLFDATRCADETFSKPHPQMLLEIMDELGVEPHQTLMIGDTEYDLQMAKNAGTNAIGVCYGVHKRERLQQQRPIACFDNIQDLTAWLNRCGIE